MIGAWLRQLNARRWNAKQGWRFVGATVAGHRLADWPVDFWQAKWVEDGRAHLREPDYGEQRLVPTWHVDIDGGSYEFAATEFSNGVYGFYLPVHPARR